MGTVDTDSNSDNADKTYRAKKTPVVSEENTSASDKCHVVTKKQKPVKKKAKVSTSVNVHLAKMLTRF